MKYYELLKLLVEAKKQYSVYILVNHTKKEVYFGVASNFQIRLQAHLNNQVEATKYWSLADDIRHKVLEEGLTQSEASKIAHEFEKEDLSEIFSRYKIIQTSGI